MKRAFPHEHANEKENQSPEVNRESFDDRSDYCKVLQLFADYLHHLYDDVVVVRPSRIESPFP